MFSENCIIKIINLIINTEKINNGNIFHITIATIIYAVYNGHHNGTNYQLTEKRKLEKVKKEVKSAIKSMYSDQLIYLRLA